MKQTTYMLDELEDINNDKSMNMQLSNLKKLGTGPMDRKKKKKKKNDMQVPKSTNYYGDGDGEGVLTSQDYPK